MTTETIINNVEILNKTRYTNAIKLLEELDPDGAIVMDIEDRNRFAVKSSKTGAYYEVMFLRTGKFCSCMDYTMKGHIEGFKCKHIQAVEILKADKTIKIQKGNLNL